MIIGERTRTTNGAMVHEMIASVAKAIAEKKYEMFASNNEFYKMFPDIKRYVALEWARFVPEARETLGKMLAVNTISQEHKEQIAEALMLDRTLPVGRIGGIISSLKKANRLKKPGRH